MISRINESETVNDEAKSLILDFSADIEENVSPAGLVEYINRFSMGSVEANGFTTNDFRVQFNRLKQKSQKPNYDFDATAFAEYFVGESSILRPDQQEEIEEAALALLRIFQNLKPFLRLDVDSTSSLAYIMEIIQDSLVFYNSLDLAFELSGLAAVDFSVRLSEFALTFRNEFYVILDGIDVLQSADVCQNPIFYLENFVEIAQNMATSIFDISDSLCDAVKTYVSDSELCSVISNLENHFALESLYDADDTVAEIRALDNLLNGQISTQVQSFFRCVSNDEKET
ncbi:unnamed protein product [Oikopleura dioica]|uniref:Uncharacterized protein n=1 Tax=Oikopleura dioica TaxID=34765 RepID=E4YSW9_OIKDI|nr:unnamed protein product [Oikopleura dioica]